jgi:outer membrane lipoprotein-sorting protein
MNVVDSFHNMTRIRFTDLELNSRLSSSLWEIKLPKGTELLSFDGEPIKD